MNKILYVGRVENAIKNVFDVFKVWQLVSKNNELWSLQIVGDGSDLEKCKTFVNDNLIPRVEFYGNRNDIDKFYMEAQFLLLTSIHEGWSMVVMEAMSYGCIPLVYDSYEAVRDIIDDDTNGFIIPPYRYDLMAEKIQQLIDNKSEIHCISEAAKEKVKIFSPDIISQQWEKLLLSL